MTKATKPNPRNRPATQADVKRAYQLGIDEGIESCWTLIAYYMVACQDCSREGFLDMYRDVCRIAEHISEGKQSWSYIKKVLEDDEHIRLHFTGGFKQR